MIDLTDKTCDECDRHKIHDCHESNEKLERCFFYSPPILMPGCCGACINFKPKGQKDIIDISEAE